MKTLNNIVVRDIPTEEVAKQIMRIADNYEYKWVDGCLTTTDTRFSNYGKETVYFFANYKLSFSSIHTFLTHDNCSDYRFMTAADFIQEFGETKDEPEYELIPFDIQKAKAGATVVTRNGRDVSILAYNIEGDYPIFGVIATSDSQKSSFRLTKNGLYCIGRNSGSDLFLKVPKPKKKTVTKWLNIYKGDTCGYITSSFYNSKEEADNGKAKNCIDTVPVNFQVEE